MYIVSLGQAIGQRSRSQNTSIPSSHLCSLSPDWPPVSLFQAALSWCVPSDVCRTNSMIPPMLKYLAFFRLPPLAMKLTWSLSRVSSVRGGNGPRSARGTLRWSLSMVQYKQQCLPMWDRPTVDARVKTWMRYRAAIAYYAHIRAGAPGDVDYHVLLTATHVYVQNRRNTPAKTLFSAPNRPSDFGSCHSLCVNLR